MQDALQKLKSKSKNKHKNKGKKGKNVHLHTCQKAVLKFRFNWVAVAGFIYSSYGFTSSGQNDKCQIIRKKKEQTLNDPYSPCVCVFF